MLYKRNEVSKINSKTTISEKTTLSTKQKLKESFLTLYSEKPLSGITIASITKKAGYNRCTFYNYYDDISCLLDEIEDELIGQIQEKLLELPENTIPYNLDMFFSQMLISFEKYGKTLYILLSKNGNAAFRQRLNKILKQHFRRLHANTIEDKKLEYILSFAISAGIGLMEHWYETGKKESMEDFLSFAQSLVANGIIGVTSS